MCGKRAHVTEGDQACEELQVIKEGRTALTKGHISGLDPGAPGALVQRLDREFNVNYGHHYLVVAGLSPD